MTLVDKRRAIRHLLDETDPADAAGIYYAFHHPDNKIQLSITPEGSSTASGYICQAKTGMDLFRPLLTLRLPESSAPGGFDLEESSALIRKALPAEAAVIIKAPLRFRPLIATLFSIDKEQQLKLLALDRSRFQPIINVFVQQIQGHDGLPRFVIRQDASGRTGVTGDIIASSGINWQSDRFAEIYVHTKSSHRRKGFGQSVVAACVQYLLDKGYKPLYAVDHDNESSLQLAESVGFVALAVDYLLIEGSRK